MGESAEECIEQGHEILGLRSLLRIAAASCKRDAVLSAAQDVLHVPSVHQGDDRLVAGGVLNLGAVVTQRAERSFCQALLARFRARKRQSVPTGRAAADTGSAWIAAALLALHMVSRPAPRSEGMRAARTGSLTA